jgi:hypothetical protein
MTMYYDSILKGSLFIMMIKRGIKCDSREIIMMTTVHQDGTAGYQQYLGMVLVKANKVK